jgi:hypothetical protein
MRTRQTRRLLAALVVGAAAFPAAAHADSLVYLKAGQIWVANADAGGARQFTVHAYNWSSPSMADDGTVVAAGGLSRVNPDGSDSDGSSELYRFQGNGNQIGTFTPTYGSYSTPACPTYPPSSVRVSPDGTKIAYGILQCATSEETALWTPAGSTGLSFPNQNSGQGRTDFWDPIWIDSTHFTFSHAGPPVAGAHWGEQVTTSFSGQGWTEGAKDDRAAEAVISRDGKESAVFFNDAAGYLDGKPRNVDLWVYYNAAMPPDFSAGWPDPAAGCRFTIDATKISDIDNLSPSLSPDGTKVLFGDDDGVKLKSLGDVAAGCDGAGPAVTIVPGGSQPFYAKGNVQPGAASPRQPDPTPPASGGTPGGGTPTGGGTTTTTSTGAVLHLLARFSFKPKKPHAHKAVTFDARKSHETGGQIVSYGWKFGDGKKGKGRKVKHRFKQRGRYTVTLTVRDAAGHKATTKHKVKVVR